MANLVVIALVLFFLGKPASALVGGTPVSGSEAKPFSGLLFVKVGALDWCTATRVTKNHLLLAAHCVTERRNSLRKANQDVRLRPLFSKGSSIEASSKTEVLFPVDWEMKLKVVRTEVPVGYHYSSYDESEGLSPETTADIALVEVETFPDSVGIIPITPSKAPPSEVLKVGYGCETDVVKDLGPCHSANAGEIRRLKQVLTHLDTPKNLYLVTPGKESGGEASLSYYDSGGPLLEQSLDGGFKVLGVNSRGVRNKEIVEREAILSDLHTSLFADSTRRWLESRLANDQKTKAILEAEVSAGDLSEGSAGWHVIDRAGRPVWQRIRSYLVVNQSTNGRVLIEGCSFIPKQIALGAPGLGPPRADKDIVTATLKQTKQGEFSFSELIRPTTIGYLRLIFDKPIEEVSCRYTVEVAL